MESLGLEIILFSFLAILKRLVVYDYDDHDDNELRSFEALIFTLLFIHLCL